MKNLKGQEYLWLILESKDRFLKLKVQKSVLVWIKIPIYFNSRIVLVHVLLLITLPRNNRVWIKRVRLLAILIHHKVIWESTISFMDINGMVGESGFEICSSLLINSKIIMSSGFPISYNNFNKGFLLSIQNWMPPH